MSDPRNACGSCRQDFASVALFDEHRCGVHAYAYSEGVAMEPMREDGRRCLDADEMTALGWRIDARGRWSHPASNARVRARFAARKAAATGSA